MGVFIGPRITEAKRLGFVPAPGELIYDTTIGKYFMGNGAAIGGLPLSGTIEGGTGPSNPRNLPSPGLDGTVLLSKGPNLDPVFDYPFLGNLYATGNTGDVVIFTNPGNEKGNEKQKNGGLNLGRMPISSLAPAGEAGQVLTSNGTDPNNAPSYQDLRNGLVQIDTYQIMAPSVGFDLPKIFDETYDTYLLIGTNIKPAGSGTDSAVLRINFCSTGKDTKAVWWSNSGNKKYFVATDKSQITDGVDAISLTGRVGWDSGCTLKMYIFNPGVGVVRTTFIVDFITTDMYPNSKTMNADVLRGCTTEMDPVTGVKFSFAKGISPVNIRSGTFTLYGLGKGKSAPKGPML